MHHLFKCALISSCSVTCSGDYLSIIYIYFMHLSSDNCVDVDARRMLNYEMWFYDVSKLRRHLLPTQVIKEPALVMQCNYQHKS